jgi:uncharacterized protein DUF1580
MIDSTTETLLSLAQAAEQLPRRRRGRQTHISTIYRWATAGCRGVVLESIQIGGTRCTSREALQRFFERLSAAVHTGDGGSRSGCDPSIGPRTIAQRRRASAEAGRKLAESGA